MPGGRKPNYDEAKQILEFVKQGQTPGEIKAQMPWIDGRSINGFNMSKKMSVQKEEELKAQQEAFQAGAQETAEAENTIEQQPQNGSPSPSAPPEPVTSGSTDTTGKRTTSFDIVKPKSPENAGWTTTKSEYYLVERLDGPERGILGQESGAFQPMQLAIKYGPGSYKVRIFRNDQKVGEAFETISPDMASASGFHGDAARNGRGQVSMPQIDPIKSVSDVMRVVNEAQDRVDRKIGEIRQEGGGLTGKVVEGLVDIVKNPQAGGQIENLLTFMQRQNENAADAHKRQMELLEKRHELDMERERERIKADLVMKEKDLDARLKQEREFLGRMTELQTQATQQTAKYEADRQKLFQDYYEKLVEGVNQLHTSVEKELEDKRRFHSELLSVERKHVTEVIDLKSKGGADQVELQKTQLWVNGLAQVGQRLEAGIKQIVSAVDRQKNGLPPPAQQQQQQQEEKPPEQVKPFDPGEILKRPDVQNLIVSAHDHIKVGKHGAFFGQVYLDLMNSGQNVSLRIYYLNYLTIKTWPEVFKAAKDANAVKTEHEAVFSSPRATTWYEEFKKYTDSAFFTNVTATP